jgi:NAD(P)-dependent dehydrogenase (short-subunit alcohol dehydrogenase family)
VEKAALITGGSSGIGFAIARALRDDGYELTLASRTRERVEAAAEELGAHAVTANVAVPEDCAAIVASHRERFGRLDVLVNGAGVGVAGKVEELPAKYVGLQLNVNLTGLVLVTQAAIPLLRETRGHVINLASIAGTIPTPSLSIYGASKAAVISFTRSLNLELEGDGVRATALCPGFVDTKMAAWTGIPGEEMIQPEDCVELVRALLRLSPRARVPQIVIERLGGSRDELPD